MGKNKIQKKLLYGFCGLLLASLVYCTSWFAYATKLESTISNFIKQSCKDAFNTECSLAHLGSNFKNFPLSPIIIFNGPRIINSGSEQLVFSSGQLIVKLNLISNTSVFNLPNDIKLIYDDKNYSFETDDKLKIEFDFTKNLLKNDNNSLASISSIKFNSHNILLKQNLKSFVDLDEIYIKIDSTINGDNLRDLVVQTKIIGGTIIEGNNFLDKFALDGTIKAKGPAILDLFGEENTQINFDNFNLSTKQFAVNLSGTIFSDKDDEFPNGETMLNINNYRNFSKFVIWNYNKWPIFTDILGPVSDKDSELFAKFLKEIASETLNNNNDLMITFVRAKKDKLYVGEKDMNQLARIFRNNFPY